MLANLRTQANHDFATGRRFKTLIAAAVLIQIVARQVSRAQKSRGWREHIQSIMAAAASTIPVTNAARHENTRKLSSTRLIARALTRFGSARRHAPSCSAFALDSM